jgi:prepilin-type N-terminal cleavage/methylation domain-containing protein
MRHKRRGISLIEIMVVITLCGILISATGICLQGVYRLDRQTRNAVAHRSAVDRLSLQFRADAHAAVRAHVEPVGGETAPAIVFTEPDGRTTEYRQQRSSIIRTVTHSGQPAHREGFLLSRGAVAAWHVDGHSPAVASLEITAAVTPGSSARTERYEAIVSLVAADRN